jgi:hypothetical protein
MKNDSQKPSFIQEDVKRKVTMSKRRRGLIKKAIELSCLCDLDIFMVVFDREQ